MEKIIMPKTRNMNKTNNMKNIKNINIVDNKIASKCRCHKCEITSSKLDEIKNIFNCFFSVYDVPGALMTINANNKTYVFKYGLSDISTDTCIDIDQIWPIRSMTKSFTVYMILMLVDAGKISLDDTIDTYLDGIPNGNVATIKQLANMSAGVPEYITDEFAQDFENDPSRIFTLDELINYSKNQPAIFIPGTRYEYVNNNTNILGAIIEKVTNLSYKKALKNMILDKFCLHDTKYILDILNIKDDIVTGYSNIDGQFTVQSNNLSIYGPSGSITSKVTDLSKWVKILASGNRLTCQTNNVRFESHKLDKGPEYDKYGLGIGKLENWWGHTGDGFGITVLMMHNLCNDIGIVITINISGESVHIPTKLFRKIAKVL